jgi:hypothetical protein
MASAHALPGLDEATFQQMLEAAFVLQERRKQPPALQRKLDLAGTLAEIAATQEVLHSKEWDLKTSAQVIAEQLQKITSATGVAVALIHEEQMEYSAAVGNAASLAGMAMPIDASLSEFLQTAAADPALIGALLKRRSSKSPFLFPIFHEGKVSGLLDVRFPECDAIPEQEVQSCQVMAGLMGQAIASAAKLEWKQALATERATMLDVLERLRPQLERLAAEPDATTVVRAEPQDEAVAPTRERTAPEIEALLTAMSQAAERNGSGASCAQCGYRFGERELFCGRCGTPRLMSSQPEELDFSIHTPPSPPSSLEAFVPVKEEKTDSEALSQFANYAPVATPFEFTLAQDFREDSPAEGGSSLALVSAAGEFNLHESEIPEEVPEEVLEKTQEELHDDAPELEHAVVPATKQPDLDSPVTWTSAAGALQWLKSLEKDNSPGRIWLAKHRGDISIALSALVLLLALTGWGLHPGSGGGAKSRLTLFERMLVSLGVAEAPPQPVASGNPNVWVWVDVHTALYYCPGSDLYGKTPGGKFALQRDAQIDQFQPAERATCQ